MLAMLLQVAAFSRRDMCWKLESTEGATRDNGSGVAVRAIGAGSERDVPFEAMIIAAVGGEALAEVLLVDVVGTKPSSEDVAIASMVRAFLQNICAASCGLSRKKNS